MTPALILWTHALAGLVFATLAPAAFWALAVAGNGPGDVAMLARGVRAMRGALRVDGREGEGTCFRKMLPTARALEQAP